ncbi:hypothetical protein [Roseovarius indicus]|uniref:hypothetical protein n=1 Tax=Roseovarius indicus TaxID=540747 RepID=UPI0032EAFCAC
MSALKHLILGSAFCTIAFAAHAADPVQQHNSNAVWFENWVGLTNATMTISAPDGEVITIQSTSGTPVFELGGGAAKDGIYRYELSAATTEDAVVKNQVDNGRGEQAGGTAKVPFYTSGSFVVSRGVIITPEHVEEEG